MNKLLIILTIIFNIIFRLSGQDLIYYDALELTKSLEKDKKFNCNENVKNSCVPVLKKYYFPEDSLESFAEQFRENPFIKEFIPNTANFSSKKIVLLESKTFFPSQISNLNLVGKNEEEPQIILKRFKEASTYSFFMKMKKDFQDYTDLKALFPETEALTKYIEADNLYSMSPIFRDAAEKDMETFLIHLSRLRLQSKYYYSMQTGRGKKFTYISMVLSGIQMGQNFADVISNIAQEKSVLKDSSNLGQLFKFFYLISSCFRDTLDGRIWIQPNQFKNLLESDSKLKILFGLMYQKNLQLKIQFKRDSIVSFNLKNELEALAGHYKKKRSEWTDYFKEMYEKARDFENKFDSIQIACNQNRLRDDDYRSYSCSIENFVESMLHTENLDQTIILPEDIKSFFPAFQNANDMFFDFNIRKYGRGFFKTIQLLDSTIFYGGKNCDSRDKIELYSIFLSNISEARTPDDVKLAVDAEISPLRSSSLKDNSRFTLSLNSYLGICGGYEYLDVNSKNISIMDISAPAGIGMYFGTPGCKSIMGHSGLFFSIIDFGMPVTFRISGFVTHRLPEMNLQNLLAPGVFIIAGRLFGSSISLGAGIQYGPQLRLVTINRIPVNSASWRWNIAVTYDLPLIYLYKR